MQERGCFVFAFAGPQEVRELELGTDMASVNNLLGFLEKVRISPHHVAGCEYQSEQTRRTLEVCCKFCRDDVMNAGVQWRV